MEIILEGIGFKTLIEIFENYNENVTGLYLDKESDSYNLYLRDVAGVKIRDDYTIVVFKNCLPTKKLRNNEYIRIVIQ